jgi:two-component sensor histidine kinase
MDEPFSRIKDGFALAQAIVNTVREPLLVLDSDLRVVVASRSYYLTFRTTPEDTEGRMLYELGAGEWNIAALRSCLERIVPEHGVKDDFEVEQSFPRIGQRTMLLNARQVFYEGNSNTTLLLAIEDITERRASERALARLLEQKDMLLRGMSHRVANSLQIIASILLLKARSVRSEETRQHLEDAHRRVMSAAALQEQLQASNPGEEIEIGPYLSKLCETLAASMVAEDRPISVTVMAEGGTATSSQAVSLGLIVTELVINALKHAFAEGVSAGHVVVAYEVDGADWKLSISDNGEGIPDPARNAKKSGLGTALINALAQQLEARVEIMTGPTGTTVSITRAARGAERDFRYPKVGQVPRGELKLPPPNGFGNWAGGDAQRAL